MFCFSLLATGEPCWPWPQVWLHPGELCDAILWGEGAPGAGDGLWAQQHPAALHVWNSLHQGLAGAGGHRGAVQTAHHSRQWVALHCWVSLSKLWRFCFEMGEILCVCAQLRSCMYVGTCMYSILLLFRHLTLFSSVSCTSLRSSVKNIDNFVFRWVKKKIVCVCAQLRSCMYVGMCVSCSFVVQASHTILVSELRFIAFLCQNFDDFVLRWVQFCVCTAPFLHVHGYMCV